MSRQISTVADLIVVLEGSPDDRRLDIWLEGQGSGLQASEAPISKIELDFVIITTFPLPAGPPRIQTVGELRKSIPADLPADAPVRAWTDQGQPVQMFQEDEMAVELGFNFSPIQS